jgi:release factor glutamine methyltransferase
VDADLTSTTRTLAAAGCIAPEEEAAELIATAGPSGEVLAALLERRVAGEPLPWLTGRIGFCGIDLVVEPGSYVPRWQTEPLARRAAELLPAAGTAVDLCTGIGAIAAVLAAADSTARVLATEADQAAAECARRNGSSGGVDVFVGNLDDPLPGDVAGTVDVVTAVVPYVPSEELHLLPRDVREHEPRAALDGGPEGTALLLEVIARSPRLLRPGGALLLELGGGQPALVAPAFREHGFGETEVLRDEEGDPRGIVARLA